PWLVRSFFIRSALLAAVPLLFFSTGILSAHAAMWTLMLLIGGHAFFQGISVTMDSGTNTRILGDDSVTPEERLRANSILSFASAVIAIIAPAIAGRVATMPDWFGKHGTGSAVLYGVYALAVALAGFIFTSLRLRDLKNKEAAPGAAGTPAAARPHGIVGALKDVGVSMKEGVKLVLKSRFLRISVLLSLISSLFSDPLVFNVLPEFVGNVLKTSPATMTWAMHVPVLGWFLQGLVSTPMGFFGLLVAFSSIGSALVALLADPVRKLLQRFGFKNEAAMTIPLYALAFLQVPAFWAMVYLPSFWGVLLLYGAQTLVAGFAGLVISGAMQKKLGGYEPKQLNQVLAAESFLSILAAILSTWLYGFVLTGISIKTSLIIAGVATTVMGVLELASPWLYFTKAERKGTEEAVKPPTPEPAPVRPSNKGLEHLPAGKEGPQRIGL
ncbi:MAG: hypothetical protein KGL53_12145, partial [Elusimicrobia bacterium]|nr:hypothetical protein [Elusimicrobiota bacterium]